VQIDSFDSNSDDDDRKTKAVPSMKKKKAEKVTVQEEQQVALPKEVALSKVAAENKEEEGPGDKEGQVLEDWVKHLQLVMNGRSRISRRYPTKDRLIECLQSCGVPASITDKKSILENLVFKTVPLDRNDLFHSGIHGLLGL
jgi:hypothetical protein